MAGGAVDATSDEGATPGRSAWPHVATRLDAVPVGAWHWRITLLAGLATFFDLYEVFLGGVLGSVLSEQWQLDADAKALLVGAPFFGMFAGAVVLGRAADRFGRRALFMVNLAGYSVTSLLAAFAPDLTSLIVLRVVAGLFLGAELPLVDTYVSELLPGAVRGRFVAVAYTLGFCGAPVAALLGGQLVAGRELLIDGWRWLLVFGGVGAAFVWLLRRSLPESPRWLSAHGRHAEADRIVAGVERGAGLTPPLPSPQLPPPAPQPAPRAATVPVTALLRPPYLRRTAMLWIFQVLQTVGYYGFGSLAPLVLMAKGHDVVDSLTYTALSFLGYPIGSAVSVLFIERLERKTLIIVSAAAIAVFGLAFGTAGSSAAIVAAGVLMTLTQNIFSNAFHVYQAELFPTEVRGGAVGIAYSLSRLTGGILPFVGIAVLDDFGAEGLFAGCAVLMALLCVDVALLGPRTTGRALESVRDQDATDGVPRGSGKAGAPAVSRR
ncbi:MFS transporter [Streptomyces sp. SID14478]|uniref:MFS transporter n=1 Tax=Streptomyces sp. SID14478 TaxID=2706073 RepID=UPI0013DC3A01|nr:MFS transporter [Streptomyces sp. SID14478]NEB75801.1 MFS transporter [Streptomyces sp. SID14478]